MKNTVSEMKNINRINSRLATTEENNSIRRYSKKKKIQRETKRESNNKQLNTASVACGTISSI